VTDRPSTGTVCPLCGVGCRLTPGEGSRARGVAGSANPNGRLCRKGVRAFDLPDEDRLTRPAVRRGDGSGDRRPVTWEAAYDRVVDRFEAIVDAHGPDALAFFGAPHCTNEENYLLGKLARTLGTNNVDNRARACHVSAARTLETRLGWPATTGRLADVREADVIVVAGANPAERQPVAFDGFVRPAVNEGATLVHLDPVGNRTTRLADVHLAPRPGTDALVFDLLSARVADAGGVDRAFVDRRTRGDAAFTAALADLDREAARSVAGVDADALDRVARLVADADGVAGLVGTGIEGGPDGTNAAAALLHLLLLTGNVGRPGGGMYVLRGLANEQGATDAGCVPDRLPGHQPVSDPAARARVAAEWGVDPPSIPGKTAAESLEAFGDEVRGALVVGENPAISKRDPDWLVDRLAALDTLVVVDLIPSETTRRADVVLPAAAGVEKAGTFTNLERRVQRARPASSPPGAARSDFRILRDLGARLVGPDAFDAADVAAVFEEWTRVAPTHADVSYADVGPEGRQWPFDDGGRLYRETFDTPDGRAAFGTTQPVVDPAADGGLRLVTGGRTSGFYGDGAADRTLRIHPADADERGLDDGRDVVVTNGAATVEATLRRDDDVRRGTVYLPARVADPLLRCETSAVDVRPASTLTDADATD
jgi:formate dehydrogenase major subunit